jgi:hypothetical protein
MRFTLACAAARVSCSSHTTSGAELRFQVLTEREEKASVAIASNESFGGWTKPSLTGGPGPDESPWV